MLFSDLKFSLGCRETPRTHLYAVEGIVAKSGVERGGDFAWRYTAVQADDAISLAREDGLIPTGCRDLGVTANPADGRLSGLKPGEFYRSETARLTKVAVCS
jgi:hypothetical protein